MHSLAPTEGLPTSPDPGDEGVVGPGSTLKLRLSLIITSLIALLTAGAGLYMVREARDDVRDEVRSTLALTGHFLDAQLDVLQDHWTAYGYAVPLFQLRQLTDIRHVSVNFYDSQGRLLDSNDYAGNHKPAAPAWFTALVRMTSTAAPSQTRVVSFKGATVGRLVMAPDPSYEIDEMWNTSRGLLALLLLFFVLVNGLVWWAVSRSLQPIDQILHALAELRRGNLATRLPSFGSPELSRISIGFNHMAETLEKSVTENQRLTRQLLNAQESERNNLARDLHDEIGQCLTAIHADAAAILNQGGEGVREGAQAIVQVTGHIKDMVRTMLRRLRPANLESLGLAAAVREQVAGFQHRNPTVACALKIDSELADIEGEVGVTIYRIIQESLTNIAVHANAKHAVIELTESPGAATSAEHFVRVTIADDGAGFFQMSADRGFGLPGIRERVRALGGDCSIETEPGRGTRISVLLPRAVSAEA